MYSFLTRNGQTVAFGIGLLVTILMIGIIAGGVGDWSLIGEKDPTRYDTTIFDFGLYASFFLMFAAALAAIVFGIYHLATNPKGALKGILGLVAVAALFLIIYSTADPDLEMLEVMAKKDFNVSPGQSKMITGAIWTALILAGTAVIATAISEIINFFK
ncbi:MAG: hypothetical protein AB8F78_03460 [Saprospiraceae bacterium]